MKSRSWLTTDEAAEHLGLGKTLVYALAQEGSIPANKIGKQWRFDKAHLDEWLRAKKDIKSFFTGVDYNISENSQLRQPQQDGYERIYEFFRDGGKVAIVQIPVGCGKTGLAAIAPFGICKGRVLYIAPNLTIKEELYDNFDINNRRKCFFRRTGVLEEKDMAGGPYVTTLDKSNISVCKQSHMVVTNIQQIALVDEKWLHKFGPDFFDMIIVDEAHHNAASSWQKIFQQFPNAKVLNLTATPFRGDKKEITGTQIYRYSFKDASIKGYIKKLRAIYAAPDEVVVFKDGNKKTYTIEQVMEMKVEDWFSKNIALSESCNINIVNNSLEKLENLRQTGTHHQLIAVACSIRHAKQIAALYKERNFTCDIIHSDMEEEENAAVKLRLKNGTLDCIVHVAMLGEGFDHPKLSVAAIFRPFRTPAPYIQFIGRIMRVVVHNNPTHPDNYGYIVTHAGMNQDVLLKDFRDFENDDAEFWAKVIGGSEPEPPLDVMSGKARLRGHNDVRIDEEIVETLFEENVFDIDDEASLDAIRQHLESLGLDPTFAKEMYEKAKNGRSGMQKVAAAVPFAVQPQKAFQEARKRLLDDTKHHAKILLNRCNLELMGPELQSKTGMLGPNLAVATMMFNKEISKMAQNKQQREQWSVEDFKGGMELLPEILNALTRKLKKILSNE